MIKSVSSEMTTLDADDRRPQYLCGRAYALLEKLCKDAGLGNDAIKFSEAASNPSSMFAACAKIKDALPQKPPTAFAESFEQRFGEVMDKLTDVPQNLCDSQSKSMFLLGYYRQREIIYRGSSGDKNS